jgi:hypothetical protein
MVVLKCAALGLASGEVVLDTLSALAHERGVNLLALSLVSLALAALQSED